MTGSSVREASHAAEAWRRVAAGSAVVSYVRWFARRARRALRPLTLDVQRGASASEFDRLPRVADDSVVLSTAARLMAGGWVDWRGSHGGRLAARLLRAWLGLDRAERIRVAAIALFVSVVTHLAMTGFRAPVPTTRARVTWAIVLAGLAAAVAAAPSLAAAWTDWRGRWRR